MVEIHIGEQELFAAPGRRLDNHIDGEAAEQIGSIEIFFGRSEENIDSDPWSEPCGLRAAQPGHGRCEERVVEHRRRRIADKSRDMSHKIANDREKNFRASHRRPDGERQVASCVARR